MSATVHARELLDRVRRTIRAHNLARPDAGVVVALSGGPDSVALTHILLELEAAGDLRVAGLAHFNHQLRRESAEEERFCVELAAAAGRPLLVDRGDVAARARAERRSVEDAARASRHAFLERARLQLGAGVVALGHTRDDQAETFLLRLLRGAGARGLAAMHPRRGHLIRPLLDCRRTDLRRFLDAAGHRFVTDTSNADVTIPRNRVRAELLPLLELRFNPAIVDVLADEAAIARDEWHWMEGAAEEIDVQVRRRSEAVVETIESADKLQDEWRIDAAALSLAPLGLARRVLRNALVEAARGRPVRFAHVEQALALVQADGPPVDGPGVRMERRGSEVVLRARPEGATGRPGADQKRENNFRFSLSIPGEVESSRHGWALEAATAAAVSPASCAVSGSGPEAVVRLDRIDEPLSVRSRRPGDRFAPPGLAGRKKLQDFFVDLKVDRARRDAVPIVVDRSDRIVWVGGYAIDQEFAVTDPAQAVLILRLKHLGGRA